MKGLKGDGVRQNRPVRQRSGLMTPTEPRREFVAEEYRPEGAEPGTLVILARHGETALNAAGRFRGRADPSLTPDGEWQARALADALLEYAPVALFTSPRRRARMTAASLAGRCTLETTITASLDDLDYGAWTGKSEQEVQEAWPDLYSRWERDPGSVTFPEGESVEQALWRAATFLRFARDDRPGETIVAVTHDAIIRATVCAALVLPIAAFRRIQIGLASTTGLIVGSAPTRLAWANETAHLRARRRRTPTPVDR
jgi:phosphoserine phosphatase